MRKKTQSMLKKKKKKDGELAELKVKVCALTKTVLNKEIKYRLGNNI